MQRSKSVVGRRAWNILRLALLWARKGEVFLHLKKRLRHHFHSLNHSHSHNGNGKTNGARQLSFDATPMIHIRMHRPNSMRFRLPHIPCINPHSNHNMFDFDDDDHQSDYYYQPRNSFLIGNGQQQQQDDHDHEEVDEEEDGIGLKAKQFIANFYEQLKLQRQFNPTRRRISN